MSSKKSGDKQTLLPLANGECNFKLTYLRAQTELEAKIAYLSVSAKVNFLLKFSYKNINFKNIFFDLEKIEVWVESTKFCSNGRDPSWPDFLWFHHLTTVFRSYRNSADSHSFMKSFLAYLLWYLARVRRDLRKVNDFAIVSGAQKELLWDFCCWQV